MGTGATCLMGQPYAVLCLCYLQFGKYCLHQFIELVEFLLQVSTLLRVSRSKPAYTSPLVIYVYNAWLRSYLRHKIDKLIVITFTDWGTWGYILCHLQLLFQRIQNCGTYSSVPSTPRCGRAVWGNFAIWKLLSRRLLQDLDGTKRTSTFVCWSQSQNGTNDYYSGIFTLNSYTPELLTIEEFPRMEFYHHHGHIIYIQTVFF